MARKRQRRSPGEGSIQLRRDNGKYRAAITVGTTAKGNPQRLARQFDTYAEADAWLVQQRAALGSGELLLFTNETLAERIEAWIATKERSVRSGTLRDYRDTLRRLVTPHLGPVPLRDLRPAHIEHLLSTLHAAGASSYTLAKAHRYLAMVLADAVRLELVTRNATQSVPRPRVQRSPLERWSAEEAWCALRYCQGVDHPVARYIILGLVSGMRKEELLGLRWQDVGAAHVTVNQTVTYQAGKAVVSEILKTAASRRTVYLDEMGMAALAVQRDHVKLAKATALKAARRWEDKDLVFPSSVGTPLAERYLRDHFLRLVDAAGAPRIRVYDLRSTHGSILADAGVNPKLISERFGHADMAFTFNRYVRTQEREARKVAVAFIEILAQAGAAQAAARKPEEAEGAGDTGGQSGGESSRTPVLANVN